MHIVDTRKCHIFTAIIAFSVLSLLVLVPPDMAAGDRKDVSGMTGKTPQEQGVSGDQAGASCGVTIWRTVPSPNVGTLFDVDDAAPDSIWALGERGILRWDGTVWSEVPWPGSESVTLNAIEAISWNDVWVVGFHKVDNTTLAIHWDGSQWSTVSTPNAANGRGHLLDVTGSSSNDVWAAGWSAEDECGEELLLHWNGSQWQVASKPSPCEGTTIYHKALAPGPGHLWLAGIQGVPGGEPEWFVVNWPTTESSRGRARINGLGSSSPNDVWVVGYNPFRAWPVVWHFDGSDLTYVASEGDGLVGNAEAIDSVSPDDAWVVSHRRTVHWDGTKWSVVPSPLAHLKGVVAIGAEDIWAVGHDDPYGGDNLGNSRILHYSKQYFHDVYPTSPFFPYVERLACNNVISGYPCGGPGEPCDDTADAAYFRPNNNISRGQIAKVVSIAAGFDEDPGPPVFQDIDEGSPFYEWVNRLANRGVISGYPCGDEDSDEACVAPGNLPYFRPNNPASRGQLAKIVSNAANFQDKPTGQTFEDVSPSDPFYPYIERLSSRSILGGYACGGSGEPCEGGNRPYFRSGNQVTRGQASKIVSNTFLVDPNQK
ncbi:MAG: S-layer homology domain-containing protein [Chloroflexota bacterium]|nr:S-layer homology domain-containing protein [Chloroflexota bacterium]MDQ5865722.1 S-layer homology domain-containing protein [Chloroflexota bacterium]